MWRENIRHHSNRIDRGGMKYNYQYAQVVRTWIGIVTIVFVPVIYGSSAATSRHIELAVLQMSDHSAVISWSGPEAAQLESCELSYSTDNASKSVVLQQHPPLEHNLELTNLQADTTYHIYMICYVTHHETRYVSNVFNITTGTCDSLTRATPHQKTSKKQNPSSRTTLSQIQVFTSPSYPTVVRNRLSTTTSSLDLALAIVFGMAGMGVLFTVTYYTLKRYRRRQRIRRFLQYRQHENEPFTDIDREEDEGIVLWRPCWWSRKRFTVCSSNQKAERCLSLSCSWNMYASHSRPAASVYYLS